VGEPIEVRRLARAELSRVAEIDVHMRKAL
jgi:hypothetical protein